MPYSTALGLEIDSGEFARVLDSALARADSAGFGGRREIARTNGRLRGLGFASYFERAGGAGGEYAEIDIDAAGQVTVFSGSQANGQAHGTTFRQIAAERLGVPYETVRLVQGDTDQVRTGEGTVGSRSLAIGGTAIVRTSQMIVDKARRIAAHVLEADDEDLAFSEGMFTVAETNRSVSMAEVARAAHDPGIASAIGIEPGLAASEHYMAPAATYPNGCHVCEVEIDEATGVVKIADYTVVDDFGTVINPMIVEGQVHGGLAQGLGQALHERCVYDPSSGQLLSGTYMDYGLPRADDLPFFDCTVEPTPCATNPLGVKGCGEAGAIGSPPAVINAILDALAPLGVTRIDMPATPETVWRAIRDAKRTANS
jgi:carbon-monoxide dehydrogenase large subunit